MVQIPIKIILNKDCFLPLTYLRNDAIKATKFTGMAYSRAILLINDGEAIPVMLAPLLMMREKEG